MRAVRDVVLPFIEPLYPDNLFGHLVATAVPGVEEWRAGAYRRTLRLAGGPAIVSLPAPPPGAGRLTARLWLSDAADLDSAVALCRRILDLDAVPDRIGQALSADPYLAPLVAAAPGRRVPGAPDAAELVARAVLGQQVSTAAARTHAGRLVLAHGEPVADPEGGLTHLFPTPQALSRLDPARLAMPGSRRRTLLGVVGALTDGSLRLDPLAPDGAHSAREQLAALPGIGPWTVQTVLMRAFADPDAFLPTDLGVRLAAERLGLPAKPGALTRHARAWRPYRAYAVQYLWATGRHPVNDHPGAPDAVAPPASTSPRPRPTSSGSG